MQKTYLRLGIEETKSLNGAAKWVQNNIPNIQKDNLGMTNHTITPPPCHITAQRLPLLIHDEHQILFFLVVPPKLLRLSWNQHSSHWPRCFVGF